MMGIYGGTFNPVHYGHLRTALEMQEAFDLDCMRFIPCYLPPHKTQPSVNPQTRLQMLQLAIANEKQFVCDDRELKREGFSYMVDTLASLKQDFPTQTLLLFIGTDAFCGLSSWHQWQRLFEYAHIVVMTRPQYIENALSEFLEKRVSKEKCDLIKHESGRLYFQNVTQLDISATKIRKLAAQGKNLRFLLPDDVIDYIDKQQLYRNLNARQ